MTNELRTFEEFQFEEKLTKHANFNKIISENNDLYKLKFQLYNRRKVKVIWTLDDTFYIYAVSNLYLLFKCIC